METCPLCHGVGAVSHECSCGNKPNEGGEIDEKCPVCGDCFWSGCVTCNRTGEVTHRAFNRLTMTQNEFDDYYRQGRDE